MAVAERWCIAVVGPSLPIAIEADGVVGASGEADIEILLPAMVPFWFVVALALLLFW